MPRTRTRQLTRSTRYPSQSVGGRIVRTHRLLAERALGRPLPKGAQIHHVNGDTHDCSPGNLVICPDAAYHKLLHLRQEAIEAGFPAHFRKCPYCKRYDDPAAMVASGGGSGSNRRHRDCARDFLRALRAARRAAAEGGG